MPFRSRATLQAWIEEFEELGYTVPGAVYVAAQDGDEGANTGLVRVRMRNASTETYIQPEVQGAVRWVATFERREEELALTAAQAHELAQELSLISALCAFLQAKSAAITAASAGVAPPPA